MVCQITVHQSVCISIGQDILHDWDIHEDTECYKLVDLSTSLLRHR